MVEHSHKAELQSQKDEVTRLKDELTGLQKEYQDAAERYALEKVRLDKLNEECRKQLEESNKARIELEGKAGSWLRELAKIDEFLSTNFPESDRIATSAVKRFRSDMRVVDLDSALRDMDEHLVSVSTRLGPLKIMGIDLHQAAMDTVKALWPGTPLPATVSELIELLKTSEDRLIDWRESAGRVMVDEVLTIVLSLYENINLDILRTLRIGSKWSTDPELVKQRQEAANRFLDFAPVHTFCPDPNPEVEEEEAEAIEEDEDEAVDEDVEAEPRPAGPNTLGADGSAPSSSGTANDPPSLSSAPAPPNPDAAA